MFQVNWGRPSVESDGRRAGDQTYFIVYLHPVKDMERRAMEIFLLCCVGWLAVLVFVLCLITVGKWADEDSARSRKECDRR